VDWGQFKSAYEGWFFFFFQTNVFNFYQVYLPAIEGYVPYNVLWTFCAFLEFCYIIRLDVITEDTLAKLDDALTQFHHYWVIFKHLNIHPAGFVLPRQHSMVHYFALIWLFGAPNGLCSSIIKSMHCHAVTEVGTRWTLPLTATVLRLPFLGDDYCFPSIVSLMLLSRPLSSSGLLFFPCYCSRVPIVLIALIVLPFR
jgi:hypothetical protein